MMLKIKMPDCIIWCFFFITINTASFAKNISYTNELGVDHTMFMQKSEVLVKENYENNLSLSINSKLDYRIDSYKIFLHGFARKSQKDAERSHLDIREAYLQYISEGYDLSIGLAREFWGVAESLHLVDVINQVDNLEASDGEDKLGQPMIRLNLFRDWGDVSLYLMPYFRQKEFASPEKRLSNWLPINKNATYKNSHGKNHLDYALRYQNYFGDLDIGISHFRGINREPLLFAENDRLQAEYFISRRNGIDLQHTSESWLLKLEVLSQKRQSKTFFASVAGFEHTIYGIYESHDLGILGEYQYDNANMPYLPQSSSNNDIFLGLRYSLNDTNSSALLVGALIDRQDQTAIYSIEAESRLYDDCKIALTGRFFSNVNEKNILSSIGKDDFINLELITFF